MRLSSANKQLQASITTHYSTKSCSGVQAGRPVSRDGRAGQAWQYVAIAAPAAAGSPSRVVTAAATTGFPGASGRGSAATPLGGPSQWQAGNAVERLYAAINSRDVAALTACFAADVQYQNLAFMDTFSGATAVARFYQDSLNALPDGAEIQLEQQAGPSQLGTGGCSNAVVWHLVLPATGTSISRGVAFFTLDGSGRILSITDSPEHPVKLSARGLTVFGPLVQGMASTMLPAVQEFGRAMQQGVDMLLQPLEGIMAAAGQDSSSSSSAGPSTWPAGDSASSSNHSSTYSSSSSRPVINGPSMSSSALASNPLYSSPEAAAPAGLRPAYAAAASPTSLAAATDAAAAARPGVLGGNAAAVGGRGSVTVAAMAAGPVGGSSSAAPQQSQPNFSGLWVKVPERSDTAGYEAALDVLGLSGLQKVTARLIEGIDIQQTSSNFTVNFVTVVPFFRVTEDVPLDGGSTQLGRRDLRFGRQTTAARSVPGGVLVEMSWGAPMAGTLTEKYTLLEDGCLCVEADTRVGDKAANSKTVYMRTNGSRDELLSDSKRRNPSVAAVLQQQRQQGLDA